MHDIDKGYLSQLARETGFIRDTLEKVIRLTEILHFLNTEPALSNRLALKGGTAINLVFFPLPRKLWLTVIDQVTVDQDGAMTFRFKNGSEVTA